MGRKIDKKDYEGKMLLKPRSKTNPTGVKDGELVTVSEVEKVPLPQTGDSWVITFREHPESLAMNKTNLKMMVKLFGDDIDSWIKQKVKLIVVLANNPKGGGETPSVRIKRKDWQYGDDENEDVPEKEDDAEQPEEPDAEQPEEPDAEEDKVKKVQDRRKK
jgi:hypothetical protein